jgi:hypothetical protein
MLGNGFRPQTLPGHCEPVRAVADNRRRLLMGVAGNGLIDVQAWTSAGDPPFGFFQPSVQDWCLQ